MTTESLFQMIQLFENCSLKFLVLIFLPKYTVLNFLEFNFANNIQISAHLNCK